jgi:hypothetical protein
VNLTSATPKNDVTMKICLIHILVWSKYELGMVWNWEYTVAIISPIWVILAAYFSGTASLSNFKIEIQEVSLEYYGMQ